MIVDDTDKVVFFFDADEALISSVECEATQCYCESLVENKMSNKHDIARPAAALPYTGVSDNRNNDFIIIIIIIIISFICPNIRIATSNAVKKTV